MLKRTLIVLISLYQGSIRHLFPAACRFEPSCSEFAKQAILKYGVFKGGLKAVVRLCRCHPWSGSSGYDPLI